LGATGTAAYRIPDILDRANKIIGEVKNLSPTNKVYLTNQLKDTLAYAAQNGYKAVLIVREGTQFSSSVQQLIGQGVISVVEFK
jgi:indole-3-glycerol phosphate synthase